MINSNIINTLICAGKYNDPSSPKGLVILEEIKEHDDINRLHWKDWDKITETLSTDDIVALVKALTIAEKTFKWIGGSASAIIWTFLALCRRNYQNEETLAHWIIEHNDNHYLPYGRTKPNREIRKKIDEKTTKVRGKEKE